MDFTILDPNISLTTNIFVIIANIINLIYNVPQMYKTWKTKSTKDFSTSFIVLRIAGNIIWIAYAIEISSFLMLLNNCVTVLASVFIFYFKAQELYNDKKHHRQLITEEQVMEKIINKIDEKV
jgi:MtN3 and saliva related transmembrane protein